MSWIAFVFALLAVGIAALCFWRAVRGHRAGRARLEVKGIVPLDADRDDDPVGFATAVWTNVALGLFCLAIAAWLLWLRPAPASPAAADIEHAWLCSEPDAARPLVHVRNLVCQPGGNGRQICDYEAMTGTELGPWVRLQGTFRRDRRTQRWCFDTMPARLGETG